jgi:uncharacterized protein
MAAPDAPHPTRPDERILALDVLRGLAMFGVLVAYCMWSLGTAPEETYTPFDKGLDQALGFLVDGKFYTILATLFGLGFSLQLGRASDEKNAVRLYRRRLAVLAGIGLLHALLLRNGDILLPYALTGFALIPFRKAPDRLLFATAFIALLVAYASRLLWPLTGIPVPQRPDLTGAPYLVENAAWVRYWYETFIFTWPINLTMFLFGLYAGRNRVLKRLASEPAKLWMIVISGLAAGGIFYFALRSAGAHAGSWAWQLAGGFAYTFHCWGMSSAYAATILLALRTATGRRVLSPLSAIGRLALTNYLMQAGLIVPLCLIFGWFDHFTPTTALLLALLVFGLVQIPFSLFWLKRFNFGPAEWVWRALSYGKAPPLTRAPSDFAPI